MMARLSLVAACVAALVFAAAAAYLPPAAAAAAPNPVPQATGPDQPAPANPQDMKKMHEQMMAEMKANRVKLEALVKEMNAARGDAKVDAIAAVVSELVAQHNAMTEHMGQMHEQMMGGRGMMMRR